MAIESQFSGRTMCLTSNGKSPERGIGECEAPIRSGKLKNEIAVGSYPTVRHARAFPGGMIAFTPPNRKQREVIIFALACVGRGRLLFLPCR